MSVHLTLLVGPLVPLPAPPEVLEALQSVEVRVSSGERSGFQLRFQLARNSPLHVLFLVGGGSLPPVLRVVLVVTLRGMPEVLSDGVVTNVEVTPAEGADPVLTVSGEDLTKPMDMIPFDGVPFPAMPPEARVALLLAKYAVLGLVPLVVPSLLPDLHSPTSHFSRQIGTDLAYIERLAHDAGYVFYIEPGPLPGASVAYWGPEIRFSVPQPALTLDMGGNTNVKSLSFTLDNSKAVLPLVWIEEKNTHAPIPIPIPPITPLSPPLGLVPVLPRRVEVVDVPAGLSPARAVMIGMARAAQSADVVQGRGTLDTLRYGRVLRARRLVGVRGAGLAFDGLHYVRSVTHTIKRGEYTQSFELRRNALVSNLPAVPT